MLIITVFSSCRKDFSTELSQGRLQFSKDTVFLDTVFTNIGSGTYTLKVYNPTSQTLTIPTISLGQGASSGYRLNVDGESGKTFKNIPILAHDSLYVFIETTLDYDKIDDPLYIDDLEFDQGANRQIIKLVTLVKDAYFLYPSKNNQDLETVIVEQDTLQGRYLMADELTFTNEKPYVIYGYMVVGDQNNTPKTLTVEAGARVYFHQNSGLIVNPNSTLKVLGKPYVNGEEPKNIVFQSDRLTSTYENWPGQWGKIWLRKGSKDHQISYAIIKNGTSGVVVEGYQNQNIPTLTIDNTQIYNQLNYSILAVSSNVKSYNLVCNNAGYSAFEARQGGVYNFTHCTLTNYWVAGIRKQAAVVLSNSSYDGLDDTKKNSADLHQANFINCIIDGNYMTELQMLKSEGYLFNYNFKNNMIKVAHSSDSLYDFEDKVHYQNNVINGLPQFHDSFENIMLISEKSEAIHKALPEASAQYPIDLNGIPRANPADIGAYEHTILE